MLAALSYCEVKRQGLVDVPKIYLQIRVELSIVE